MFNKRIRAWHKENKQMYKVLVINFEDEQLELDTFIAFDSTYIDESIKASFDEVVIMQESGLQDENGFNVFEGDLIKFEGEVFVLMNGDFGDSCTQLNGFGWHLAGEKYTFVYVGGGEKVGNSFENSIVEK